MARYSIWMAECCRAQFKAEHLYGGYYKNGESFEFPLSLVVIKGEGRIIMIDSGVDPTDPVSLEFLRSRNFSLCKPPAYALEKIGLKPEDITDIIVTHAHWDHIGAINCFPNAQVYIQKEEYFKWIEMLALPKEFSLLSRAIAHKDFEQLLGLTREHRLTLLDGPCDNLFPGIHIKLAKDGHSFAGQMIVIETEINGKIESFMAVGDSTYVEENVLKSVDGLYLPTALSSAAAGPYGMLKTMQDINSFCQGDIKKVLIVHDYKTWSRYPSCTDEEGLNLAEVCLAGPEQSKLKTSAPAKKQ